MKLLSFFLALFLLTGCQQYEENAHLTPPNIILFLVDDMGWQDTSVPFWKEKTPFNQRYRTPNMERLAAEGMKFTQAYATSVCSPTRISLMTGMNAARHRVTNWTLTKNQSSDGVDTIIRPPAWNINGVSPIDTIPQTVYATTLPELLQDAGYFTIHVGKAHFAATETPCEEPLNCGFDVNIAGHAAGAPGSYQGLENFGNNPDGTPKNRWSVPGLSHYHGQDIHLSEALTREAMRVLDTVVNKEKPFYLYMAHYAVHIPIQADARFIQPYLIQGLDSVEARYASMVEGMDKSLGDLMDYLETNKLAENTIILFMSDNGGLSAVARGGEPHSHNAPLSSGKGSAREGGVREPMIVKWPGVVQAASTCDDYLIIEDFFPTVLEMAGVTDPQIVQDIDGLSFVPMLRQTGTTAAGRALYWHYPNIWGPEGPGIGPSSSVRLGDWKMIYYHRDQHFELFDLAHDISETQNLATDHPEKLKELAANLTTYLQSVDAQMPVDLSTGETVPLPAKVLE